MELQNFSHNDLVQMRKSVAGLRQEFAGIMEEAATFRRTDFPLEGIAMTAGSDGESIRISYGAVAVDLLLTYSRLQTGGFIGRITAMLVKHPLEPKPVQLDWFTIDRQGEADVKVQGYGEERPLLRQFTRHLVLTLIDRALTHLPAES